MYEEIPESCCVCNKKVDGSELVNFDKNKIYHIDCYLIGVKKL